MAAETIAQAGFAVDLFDAMPSVGRKFLMAGKGGMNLTHAEPYEAFLSRYGARRDALAPIVECMRPEALRAWTHALGFETFVGTSGRVFPTDMKAAPMLRAWLHRLRELGVRFHMRHRWTGAFETTDAARGSATAGTHDAGRPSPFALRFQTPDGERPFTADAVVLALGGGSWPRLGSDGAWVAWLRAAGIDVEQLQPANCGFDVAWSEHFRTRHAGDFIKSVSLGVVTAQGTTPMRQGECVVTETGIEGSLVYALSSVIRETIHEHGHATIVLDLAPGLSEARVLDEVRHPRGSRSMSSHLRSRLGIAGVKAGLVYECVAKADFNDPARLAAAIKRLPLRVERARPIEEAISSAGGVRFESLDERLMLRGRAGLFCAGEMLDWEAPTGGYLLTACFASGRVAGRGVVAYLGETR
ncbi:TIGR03862 family flavoprotein [Pararobbsia silviterrae]